MPFERLVARTRTRLAKGAFAALLRSASVGGPAGTAASAVEPRGSGSWANDWSEGGSAMERAMSLALPNRGRPAAIPAPAAPDRAARHVAAVRTKPLMSLHEVRLHNWIVDRLEAEAPTCSLHARVAFPAFLAADPASGGPDPLQDLVADMLIADRNGQPVAALIRETAGVRSYDLRLRAVLRDADLPVVDIPARPGLADLWTRIAQVLPGD